MRHRLVVSLVSILSVGFTGLLVGCSQQEVASSNAPSTIEGDESDQPDQTQASSDDPEAQPSASSADDSSGTPDASESPDAAAESTVVSDGPTPAGSALKSIFSPARAPQRKTMGLLQRSFLDIAAEGDQELEVAVVIDGTDSMSTDIQGVRNSILQMLGDLRKYRSSAVRAAIVIYRDDGSPSGPFSIPQAVFTDDDQVIEAALQKLEPESGKPYFHELPDLGIYKAIHDLEWSSDDQVNKWILLFGDAPPYAESRVEKKDSNTHGFRRFATTGLVGAAKAKGIRINCVLCTSTEGEPYEKSLDETRAFMRQLAGGTEGLMLDLSNPQIQSALVQAAKQPERQYAEINPITAIDLASVRREDLKPGSANEVQTVRVAILPHMPLEQLRTTNLPPKDKAVQVATALRSRLAQVRGVRVESPVEIQRQVRRFNARNLSAKQRIRGLAGRLGVDYIVWGQAESGGASYQTAAYRRDNGLEVVKAVNLPADSDPGTWAHIFLTAASEQAGDDDMLGKLLSRVENPETIQQPMSNSRTNSAVLLEALEALDQALEYDTRSDKSTELLKIADRASASVAKVEPRNALAHWLQANVAYNQAAHLFSTGETGLAKERMQEMKRALNLARDHRDSVKIPSLKTEIEADYLLLIRRDFEKAVARYQEMTTPEFPLQSQLRGRWMLAGIHAGDWGAKGELVDPNKARTQIVHIMANWPKSPQATLLKTWLKYDETSQQTEYNYLPVVNVELSSI